MYEMTNFSFGSLEFHIKKGQVENSKERKKEKKEKKKKKKGGGGGGGRVYR